MIFLEDPPSATYNLNPNATGFFLNSHLFSTKIKRVLVSQPEFFPKPYNTGFKVRLWNDKGTITTPWFGQVYNETYFLEDKEYHVTLEIPENVKQYIGDGTLVVEIEADIQEEDEEVFYSVESKYKLYSEKKKWEDAENHCKREGGHLASVQSEQENQEIEKIADGRKLWIGGTDRKDRIWKWTDGSKWQLQSQKIIQKDPKCQDKKRNQAKQCLQTHNGTWVRYLPLLLEVCKNKLYQPICLGEAPTPKWNP